MKRVKRYDKLIWLETHGMFISSIETNTDYNQQVMWESTGGQIVIPGIGINAGKMYDNLYADVKNILFIRCENLSTSNR